MSVTPGKYTIKLTDSKGKSYFLTVVVAPPKPASKVPAKK
jgi:hypothetical protein